MSLESKSQDYDSSSFSGSSAGGLTRNTWSSSTGGLIQIGSFKFAQSNQDDLSMGEDSTHRFSVIIHDNTDVDSLTAAASSRQIESLNRVDDNETSSKAKRGIKVFGRLKPTTPIENIESSNSFKKKSEITNLQKPRRAIPIAEEDPFDQFCNAFERFACRKKDDVETGQLVPINKEKFQHVVEPPFVQPVATEHRRAEERDALDTVFEEVESMTCGPVKTLRSKEAITEPIHQGPVDSKPAPDNRDALERVFDGVEIMTCGPDSSHEVETFKRYGTKTPKRKKSAKGHKTDLLDRLCESVEHYTWRLDDSTVRFSQERDLLDKVFDGVESASCSQKTAKRGNMTNRGATDYAEHPIQVPEETQMIKKSGKDDDVLESLFNGVEHAVCRNETTGSRERYVNDLLEQISEAGCADSNDEQQSFNENSMVASGDSESVESSRDVNMPEESDPPKQLEEDLLDYIFEAVESKTCRPSNDDLSVVQHSNASKRSGKRLWGKFLFSRN
jgi:hypothetical protein